MALSSKIWSKIPKQFLPHHMRREEEKNRTPINIEHFCAAVLHPVKGKTISKYQTLARDPVTK